MVLTACALGLLAFALMVIEYAGGRNFVTQPLVVGTMVGLVMGDLPTGITVGATLELAFLGATSIGAVIPPDAMSGSLLGVAFVINAGVSAENALVLALPIASLMLIFKNFYYGYVVSLFERKVEKCAESGDWRGVERIHWATGLGFCGIIGVVCGLSYALGSDTMSALLAAIPPFVQTGLNVAIGIIPAVGFTMLAKTMLAKANAYIFLCGFALVAYFQVPILGVAIFGAVFALAMTQLTERQAELAAEGGDEDEF